MLTVGLVAESRMVVTPSMLVPGAAGVFGDFSTMPPVLATMYLVGFLEETAIKCILPHQDAGQHSLGTDINVTHVAPTPAGMEIRARAELVDVTGRSLRFRVTAWDAAGLIGEGTHRRAVIDVARFTARVADKAAGTVAP
ncbi:fluoroacetyl-CoA thioesterase [Loktanella fryxellensis]|uniref:Fluoroacetyl-CoA thioesterase n=1 Tax=Loktanella fryxellensis TaxID=245187 RepID=A0A1H7YYJ0_9RHOB|nr:thioesterase family protein [Loktanella fryxellensis]SEM50824.1 fluoroacetyl-CoA thioesterase [Loktanella fryxellensis]